MSHRPISAAIFKSYMDLLALSDGVLLPPDTPWIWTSVPAEDSLVNALNGTVPDYPFLVEITLTITKPSYIPSETMERVNVNKITAGIKALVGGKTTYVDVRYRWPEKWVDGQLTVDKNTRIIIVIFQLNAAIWSRIFPDSLVGH